MLILYRIEGAVYQIQAQRLTQKAISTLLKCFYFFGCAVVGSDHYHTGIRIMKLKVRNKVNTLTVRQVIVEENKRGPVCIQCPGSFFQIVGITCPQISLME